MKVNALSLTKLGFFAQAASFTQNSLGQHKRSLTPLHNHKRFDGDLYEFLPDNLPESPNALTIVYLEHSYKALNRFLEQSEDHDLRHHVPLEAPKMLLPVGGIRALKIVDYAPIATWKYKIVNIHFLPEAISEEMVDCIAQSIGLVDQFN